MKRTAATVGALILAAAVGVVLLGALQPIEHQAQVSVDVAAPPMIAWAAVRSVEDCAAWRSGVDRVTVQSRQPLRWTEHRGGDALPLELVREVPLQGLVLRIADDELPFSGTWTIQLRPHGAGTRVTIVEHGAIPNVLVRFFAHLVVGPDHAIRAYAEDLQTHLGAPA